MADSKLRLAIVTQLDNAGIKATKEQILQLEKAVKNVNKESGEGGGDSEAGIFGKWSKQLTKVAGKATAIFTALKFVGNAIQNTITEAQAGGKSIGEAIGSGIYNTCADWGKSILKFVGVDLDEIAAQEQKRLDERCKALQDSVAKYAERVHKEQMQRLTDQQKAHVEILKGLDAETKAYKEQVSILQGLHDSWNGVERTKLEREKFEDIQDLKSQGGTDEQVEQLSKAWDVRIAQEEAVAKLRRIDTAVAVFEKETEGKQRELDAVQNQIADLREKKKEHEDNVEMLELNNNGTDVWKKQYKEQKDFVKQYAEEIKPLVARRKELKNYFKMVDYKRADLELQRVNVAETASLGVDKLAASYDDFTSRMENPLEGLVDDSWSKELLESSQDSYEALIATRDNTAGLKEKLDELLAVKQ